MEPDWWALHGASASAPAARRPSSREVEAVKSSVLGEVIGLGVYDSSRLSHLLGAYLELNTGEA